MLCWDWTGSLNHIPKDPNSVADHLAKCGAHENVSFHIWSSPPSNMFPLLLRDCIS